MRKSKNLQVGLKYFSKLISVGFNSFALSLMIVIIVFFRRKSIKSKRGRMPVPAATNTTDPSS